MLLHQLTNCTIIIIMKPYTSRTDQIRSLSIANDLLDDQIPIMLLMICRTERRVYLHHARLFIANELRCRQFAHFHYMRINLAPQQYHTVR